jgi:hypothetical protein
MKKNSVHYKFINNETDNIIYFLSIPESEPDHEKILEATKNKLAIENGIYIGAVYYIKSDESDFEE